MNLKKTVLLCLTLLTCNLVHAENGNYSMGRPDGSTGTYKGGTLYHREGSSSTGEPFLFSAPKQLSPPAQNNFRMPQGIFTGVSGNPELDSKFHEAMVNGLIRGTYDGRRQLSEVKTLLEKYGSPSQALEGLSKERASEALSSIEQVLTQRPSETESSSLLPLRDKLTGPLADATKRRYPIAIANELADLDRKLARTSPEARNTFKSIPMGILTDSSGLVDGFPEAPSLISLTTDRFSEEGQRLRASMNRYAAAEQLLQARASEYCQNNEAACEQLKPYLDQARSQYVDISLAHAMADRMGLRYDPAFDSLMRQLEAISAVSVGISEGLFEAGADVVTGIRTFVSDPLGITKSIVVGLSDAIQNYDRTYATIQLAVSANLNTILYGSPQDAGKVLGKIGFEVVSNFIPVGAVANAGAKLTVQAAKRAALTVALKEGIPAAKSAGKITAKTAAILDKTSEAIPQTGRELLKKGESLQDDLLKSKAAKTALATEDAEISLLARQSSKDAVEFIKEADNISPRAPPSIADSEKLIQSVKQRYPELIAEVEKKYPGQSERFAKLVEESKSVGVDTRFNGVAKQELSLTALEARHQINEGKRVVYRRGEYGNSRNTTAKPDFENAPTEWALEHPITTLDYDQKYGVFSGKLDWVEMGVIDDSTSFVTKAAKPGRYESPTREVIVTRGGGIEVVVPPGGVKSVKHINVNKLIGNE